MPKKQARSPDPVAILSIIVGIIILIWPDILAITVGVYLIIIGLLRLTGQQPHARK